MKTLTTLLLSAALLFAVACSDSDSQSTEAYDAMNPCPKLESCRDSEECQTALKERTAGPAYEICIATCAGMDWNKDQGEALYARFSKCGLAIE